MKNFKLFDTVWKRHKCLPGKKAQTIDPSELRGSNGKRLHHQGYWEGDERWGVGVCSPSGDCAAPSKSRTEISRQWEGGASSWSGREAQTETSKQWIVPLSSAHRRRGPKKEEEGEVEGKEEEEEEEEEE
eukprot:CAMPEP_0196581530 /NCGR_PEP_ID=MMETSP1081-20130531/34041_1 /TAXON_ID=36882 /ORGANISM="Pyramimonas amylifera, Strain CCMP720" /LENGTH=129 /DNA_ID=CAMNT_0041901789 /DNA_START=358 /DNA_END=745 /DNA_ORIENTATION=+